MAIAARKALDQLVCDPGIGSPRIGELLDIPRLRGWRLSGLHLVWSCFERDDQLDFTRLLGERQDILGIRRDH